MTTINDVARISGVSKSTVSKVVNNYPGVSRETKNKVQTVIDELNYIPSEAAIRLSKKNANKIAIIIKTNNDLSMIDELTVQFMHGVKDMSSQNYFEPEIHFSRQFADYSLEQLMHFFKSRRLEGLVIFGLNKDEKTWIKLIESENFKIVLVDAKIKNKYTTSIMVDNYKAQYEIAKKYVELNQSKKILYLKGKANSYVEEDRTRAIEKLESETKLDITYEYGDFNEDFAYDYTLENYSKFDMLICASDGMAIGCKRALRDLGKSLPIVGFDGVNLLGYVAHDIPTVKQDFYGMSKLAVSEIIKLLNEEPSRVIYYDYSIGFMDKKH